VPKEKQLTDSNVAPASDVMDPSIPTVYTNGKAAASLATDDTPTLDELLLMSDAERDKALGKLSTLMASLIDQFPELVEFNVLDGEEFRELGA